MSIRTLSLALICTAAACFAQSSNSTDFPATFSNCSEYAGTGPIPFVQAAAMVPGHFTILSDNSHNATLVVRSTSCQSISVDNFGPEPGVIAHIGVSVVSPDGTGDINNFTVAFATNNTRLAQRLKRAGLPVIFDSDLVYQVTPNPPITTSELYSEVSPDDLTPGWSLDGQVTNNAFLTTPFLANWWYQGPKGVIRMSTNFPSITFKAAQATVTTRLSSPLGKLIQSNHYSFDANTLRASDFNVRGEYTSANLSVTVR